VTTHNTRRLVAAGGILLAALTSCGSEPSAGTPQGLSGAVSMRDLPGLGTVLVDSAGKTLYFTDSDQPGAIQCVAECVQVWLPSVPPNPNPQGVNLGVVQRPEGTSQLTFKNKPLYTFTLDSQDKPASGNNASDSFGGVNFTWHAVILNGNAPAPTTTDGGGYGGGGGGY
jgi:predicted lipoprotein with Yx(FWY)xxD motif